MWNERYSAPGYAYGTEPNDFLASVASQIPLGRVLSLGDGEGRNGVFLASLGHDVTSVDQSYVGLAKAQALAVSRGLRITTVAVDLAEFSLRENAWSGIASIFCHLPSVLRRCVHKQVVRGLVPGGLFVLEAYTVDQLCFGTGGPTNPDMLPSLDVLRGELEGLEFLYAAEIDRVVREGIHHDGRSAVVQVIARRPIQGSPAGSAGPF